MNLFVFAVHTEKEANLKTLIGQELNLKLKKYNLLPITIIYRNNRDNSSQYLVSFRSDWDHIDCGEISKLYGGGGHPKAASFRIKKQELDKSIFHKNEKLSDLLQDWETHSSNLEDIKSKSNTWSHIAFSHHCNPPLSE